VSRRPLPHCSQACAPAHAKNCCARVPASMPEVDAPTAAALDLEADAAVLNCLEQALPGAEVAAASPSPFEVAPFAPSPFEVVLRYEDRAEEWHFDEAVHNMAVQELKTHGKALKDRHAAANDRAAREARASEEEASGKLNAVSAEEQEIARELAGLREEFLNMCEATEQLRRDCDQEVAVLEREASAERERTVALEADLLAERQSRVRGKQRIQEIEDREIELMRAKQEQISKHRADAQSEIMKIQRVTDDEVHARERSAHEEVDLIQKRIDAVQVDTRLSVGVWLSRRKEACDIHYEQFMQDCDNERLVAAKKLGYILPREDDYDEEAKMRNALAYLGGQD